MIGCGFHFKHAPKNYKAGANKYTRKMASQSATATAQYNSF